MILIDGFPVSPVAFPVTFPVIAPENDAAVTIPDAFIFLYVISPVVIWSSVVNPTLPVLP